MKYPLQLLSIFPAVTLIACSTSPPISSVEQVDLQRFMGDWYVIANIPTFIEREAHNAVESYELVGDRQVETTFSFNQGSFDGPLKVYTPTGFVTDDPSNAIWGMQFIWPIKADYRVIYLDDGYTQTVIGRNKRDYVWIMARSPAIPGPDFDGLVDLIERQGYDTSKLRLVPQQTQAAGVERP